MINLMPDETKKEIRAARVNVMLARYIFVIIAAFLFLVMLLAGSYVVLTQTKQSAQLLIDSNDTKAAVYSTTKAQVDTLSASLSEARTILDQEILYSKVLANIGQQLPEGTVIGSLNITSANFSGTPLNIDAYAKTNEGAVALREKFQTSPYFTDIKLQSVTDGSTGINGYPVKVSLSLVMNRTIAK